MDSDDSYATVFRSLDELNFQKYKNGIYDNLLTDQFLKKMLGSGLLMDCLKEVIPPLAHRIAVLEKLSNNLMEGAVELPVTVDEDGACSITIPAAANDEQVSIVFSGDTSISLSSPSGSSSAISDFSEDSRRMRKRKRFHDEEPDILDIKYILRKHDLENHTTHGQDIINICDSRNPLPKNLRTKLVQITSISLMTKTNSDRPSTDQRQQLASSIVNQLFSFMSDAEKQDMQLCFYTPTFTFVGRNGKKESRKPVGHIQYFFENFWRKKKPIKKLLSAITAPEAETAEYEQDMDELVNAREWLKVHKGPPQQVFEKLNQTHSFRKSSIKGAANFKDVVFDWPRLFDIESAIQNDFGITYSLTCDNLFKEWTSVSAKLLQYAGLDRRKCLTIGIRSEALEELPEVGALLVIPFLCKPKAKRMTQSDSVDAFIKVFTNDIQFQEYVKTKDDYFPQIAVIGDKSSLSFSESFVVFQEKKSIRCDTILQAVDLSFKSFYVFSIEFPPYSSGAYQFLDHGIYNMKSTTTVNTTVKELAVYVCKK